MDLADGRRLFQKLNIPEDEQEGEIFGWKGLPKITQQKLTQHFNSNVKSND